jgi:caa(3)-type oxidase subunit IV
MKAYAGTWIALVLLTLLSWSASRLVTTLEFSISLGIAVTKAALVAFIFMHMGRAKATHQAGLIVAVVLILILIGLSSIDMWMLL